MPAEPPPRLPAVEADLDAWGAHAAELRAAGDPRGALMELDLSLPALVEREALRAFHAASARICRDGHAVSPTWCLAHIHTLAIWPTSTMLQSVSPEHGALARARDLALAPYGQRLEELVTVWPAKDHARHWHRLMRALPATCRKVTLLLPWRLGRAMASADLLASLAPTVRELGLREEVPSKPQMIESIIDDRLDVVDLDGVRKVATLPETIAASLSRTRRVHVRLSHVDPPLHSAAGDRIILGNGVNAPAPESALLDRAHERTAVLRRWHVGDLQRHYGILPVRAQLARLLPERHGVSTDHPLRVSHWDADLVQRGAAWTIRGAFESQTALNERTLAPGEVVTLAPGDQLRFGEVVCELRPGARVGAT